MMQALGVSGGIGIAPAILWQAPIPYSLLPQQCVDTEAEARHFKAAVAAALAKNRQFVSAAKRRIGSAEASIFEAHCELLQDDEGIIQPVLLLIGEQSYSAEYAVMQHFGTVARKLLTLQNEYIRQRADDMFSLRDQLLREMLGLPAMDASHFDAPTVVVAQALSAADVANMDRSRLQGIVCETGSYSCHTAILARALGIPAIVGADGITWQARPGDLLALDGGTGEVWVKPSQRELDLLRGRYKAPHQQAKSAQGLYGAPTVSLDGRRVELSANVGHLDEVDTAVKNDCESIGLYRTELLHLNHLALPDEETQLHEYLAALQRMNGRAVTVRTLDAAANGEAHIFEAQKGKNPALGYRGIRMGLGQPSMLYTQLRALLRASAYGSIKIMLPMVTFPREVDETRSILEMAKKELRGEGIPFDEKIPLGVLVEVPGTAMLAATFAQKADFLTIGLNDLVQFTLAVDRDDQRLAPLCSLYHPAVLRLIHSTVQGAHQKSVPCNLCGEVPSLRKTMPLLLGLSPDGFSLGPTDLLPARQVLNGSRYEDCRKLAVQALECISIGEVDELLEDWVREHPLPQ